MKTYIILLRGVNVGGKNKLPMKELQSLLESHDYHQVQTYIQSGNIVLKNQQAPSNIGELIQSQFGFTPKVMVLDADALHTAATNNPYQGYEGKFVHVYFCSEAPQLNTDKLDRYIANSERYTLIDGVFYLHAPDGIGRSKLVANIESCLGVAATGRNLNTVDKIRGMVESA